MGSRIRAHDWARTPLGDLETWPRSLKTAACLMLTARQPAFIAWGPGLTSFYNDAFVSIAGGRDGLGRPVAELWPAAWNELRTPIEGALAGEAQSFESAVFKPGGRAAHEVKYFTYSVSPLEDDNGLIAGIFWTGTEATGQSPAEAKLFESEERLRLAVEAAGIGLWDVDPVAGLLYWPPRVKAMFGISPEVPVSMADFYAGLHPEDRPRVTQAFAAALDPNRRALYGVEYRTIGKEDGAMRWVAAKGRGIFDNNGVCIRVIGTAIDISARKEDERRLRELNETLEARVRERTEELAAANRQLLAQIQERERTEATLRQMQRLEAVGQLTSGVAHDFNNLLTVIMGQLDFVSRDPKDEKTRRRFAMMQVAAERAARLTAQLLAFSRRQHLNPKPVDLKEAVEGMSELLRVTLGGTVRLDTILRPGLRPAFVDRTQLELVILNLAINARDAMPAGGRLTIETGNVTLGLPDTPHAPGPGDYAVIAVTDTGTGMTPGVLEKAFEPFFTTKEPGIGSGLGLAQVHGFAKQSGGGVRIETQAGEGTSVKVYVPRATVSAARDVDAFEGTCSAVSGRARVLLVDDDSQVREVTRNTLEDIGYGVIEAENGGAALDRLERDQEEFAAALIDFAMPGMNGAALAKCIALLKPSLPIMFITGYADSDALAAIGDFPVLAKPIVVDQLASALRNGNCSPPLPAGVLSAR